MEIEKRINVFVNKKEMANLKLEKMERIKDSNTWVAILSYTSEKIVYAHLEKNWWNRYRIISVGGVPDITYVDMKTDTGSYGVLIGMNQSLAIKKIDIKTMGETQLESTFDIEEEKYFIKYIRIEDAIGRTSPAEFTLYDKNNQIIANH